MNNHKGQALVESAIALWLLIASFICVYYTLLLAVDKLRALEGVYYASRVLEVQKSLSNGQKARVCFWKFGRPAAITSHEIRQGGPEPAIQEVRFQYLPRTFIGHRHPWETVMWAPEPNQNRDCLWRSWPGARKEQSPKHLALIKEAMEAEAHAELLGGP